MRRRSSVAARRQDDWSHSWTDRGGRAFLRCGALIAGASLALAGGAPRAHAQAAPQHGGVRGAVRTTLGNALPYAVVVLEPGFPPRFTNDSGAFAFSGLAAGTYHLRARQVGYRPFDTTVVVAHDSTVVVAVPLERLVVELAEIRVVVSAGDFRRCTTPGPPDAATSPEFAAVFEQLRQNAERYWMLADSYPAVYRMERRFGRPDHYNRTLLVDRTDTVDLSTDARWHYAPGRVLTDVTSPRGATELQVNLPGLPDLADTTFLMNHCFRFAGVDDMQGARYARLDFRVAEQITAPDADGSAYLDTSTYVIRFLTMRLTRPERAAPNLQNLEATVEYREVVPSLVLPDRISSVQTSSFRSTLVEAVEEQRSVGLHFLQALPKQRP